ncbi:MAG: hypothetical protein ACLRR1_09620 [Alistipes shahii]|uniref:hypothetical protein n=1 Tax=Alistipes shahii TaxID=328814 RepID=UPI00399076D9
MHIHVNTASEHLRDFAERLPELFDREGEVLHAGRNTIKAFEAEGERLVVKRFKRPNLLRAVIYTFFRRSKARRSYEHAVRLRALGVDSPEPVAWSEYRRRGLLCDSYYVSRRSDYTPLSQTTARFPRSGDPARAGGLRPLHRAAPRERHRAPGLQPRQHPLGPHPPRAPTASS